MEKNCILIGHIHTGDMLTYYPILCHISKLYKKIYIFCLYRNKELTLQLYKNFLNILLY